MRIQVTDEFELRDIDALNWQVYEFREVEKKDGTKYTGWMPRAAYFNSLSAALDWIMRQLPRSRKNQAHTTLADALNEIHGIAKEVGKYAKKFEEAMK